MYKTMTTEEIQGSHFSVMTKFHDFSMIFPGFFHRFPGVIFFFLNVPHTPFDPLISLLGRDSDLKSHEPCFSSFEKSSQTSSTLVKV